MCALQAAVEEGYQAAKGTGPGGGVLELGWPTPVWSAELGGGGSGPVLAAVLALGEAALSREAAERAATPRSKFKPNRHLVRTAVGETAILLHPPSSCSRRFNRDDEGVPAK